MNTNVTPASKINFLSGGGEMGERIRSFDWAQTSLGPVDSWPRSLKTCIQIMLNSRQPIWIGWGPELIKIYNDPYKTIVGGKHPWALGKPASVVWKDIWKDIEPLLKKVMVDNEGTYVETQLLIMERNGYPEETYYTFSYTPVAGDHGSTEGMICANVDDTKRIISERQLKTLTRLGKKLADVKSDTEVFKETIDTIAENPYDFPFALLYETSGHSARLVRSTTLPSGTVPLLINLDETDDVSQRCNDAVQERGFQVLQSLQSQFGLMPRGPWETAPDKAIVLPIAQRGTKDAYGFMIVGLNPYRILDEQYTSFFALIADLVVTSLNNVHALDEERKRLDAFAEIDRAKTTFFSNISHEFRTPLTLFLGPIEDLLNDPDIRGHNKERVDVAFRNALRLQKLVNLLLDFSRIEAGRMEAHFTPVDIVAITQDLTSNFRSAVEKAGMNLRFTADPIDHPVSVDLDMWEKIMLNLLSNAFKYSEEGTIEVLVKKEDGQVSISVSDTGVGIPEKEIEKIFERFHRVQNVKGRTQEGTGIGLAMVKELVKLHGGTIGVKSKLGEGSTFTVSLPLVPRIESEKLSGERPGTKVRSSASAYVGEAMQWIPYPSKDSGINGESKGLSKKENALKRSKILLADDNADMRNYVQRLLGVDFDVVAVGDGEEAFSNAVANIPDLILSDIMMPKLDGFGLLKKLKTNLATRNIPVIFLSARAGEEAKVEGLRAGADDYLVKPFSSKELIARVTNHILISTARRHAEKEFFNLFLQSPAHIHVFRGPDHIVEFFHPLGTKFTGRDITGLKIREALPEMEGQGFFEILDKVYKEGMTIHANNSKATFKEDGVDRDFYFDITYLPWKDMNGNTQGILQFTFEVTETVQQRLKAESSEQKFRGIAQQAPVSMTLLMGPTHIVEVANNKVLEMWGKEYDEVIGKPVLEIFPEIVDQGLGKILDDVFTTGKPFLASELPITFHRNGEAKNILINLIYEPFRNENNEIEGIVAVGTDVTEQVVARKKVAEAELKFRTVIEQTPSPLCIFKGREMTLEVANDATLQVWQVGKEVIGKRLIDIVPEMQRQPFLELMLDVYDNAVTRHGYEAPAYFIRKDGTQEERFFNFIYVPYRDVQGLITGVLVLATDVTDQVLAKKQLTENEERLRIATEILELGTWEFDILNDVIYCSDKTVELFGFTEGKNIKLADVVENVVTEDKEKVLEAVRAVLTPGSSGSYDVAFSLINRRDKKRRTIRANGQVFFDENKNPYRFIGTALDITERTKADEKIKASEARFRLLATSIPQIVWTTDKDGNTNYISGQFENFTGRKPEKSYGSWPDLVHPADRERLLSRRLAAVKNGTGWQEEFRLKNATGDYRWFLGNSQPLKDSSGTISMWIGSASDIQDLKEQSSWLEQQVQERTRALKELNQSLKVSNEDLQQFAHVASHDLKEPIRKIKTYSNRLYDEYRTHLPEKGAAFLLKILSATDRMYAMIDGVLSYSTMAAMDQPMERVDLNDVVKNIVTDLEVLIQEKKATISHDSLPIVEGAPVLLYQLLYNLVNNSIKFSKDNEPPVITLQSSNVTLERTPFVKIILRDNGIGFDQDQAERIFTTFTRLNSKDKYEGTGLGLALCKKIVQRHGGSISATGEKNIGAEFTILLPYQ